MALNAKDTIAAARLIARKHAPYLRSAILSMVMEPKEGMGTMGTSADWVCYYDPKVVVAWGPDETATVLVHEVSHLLRDHLARIKAITPDHMAGNIAADLEINDDLAAARHFKVPKGGWQIPSAYKLKDGLTMEEYYRQLPRTPGGGVAGLTGTPQPGNGRCGGCAANPVPGEPQGKGGGGPEDVPDSSGHPAGRAAADIKRIRKETAIQIREHAQKAERDKSQGSVPGGWLRWAEGQLTPPKVRWEDQLPHMIRHAINVVSGRQDYTYRRLNRRQPGLGYGVGAPMMPSMQRPVPRIAVSGDTSGSMGEAEMKVILGTVAELLKGVASGAQIEWIACDSEIHAMKTVSRWEEVAAELKGGGGTDFRPVFDELSRRKTKRVDLLIYVTDGYGSAPAHPPKGGMKVVWLITSGGRTPAPWGFSLRLDNKPLEEFEQEEAA